jgi:predicted lactoylglutathione lyase
MIGYMNIGTTDLARAAGFYDAIAMEIGAARVMEDARFIAWGAPGNVAMLCVCLPYDGNAASVGNGVMAALAAKDKEMVGRIYDLALSLGGTDEGKPGPRGEGFYAAYFRDLDGNKLNAYCFG